MYTTTRRATVTTACCSSILLLAVLHVTLVAVAKSHSIAVITAVQTSSLSSSSSSHLDGQHGKDTSSDGGQSQQYIVNDGRQNDESDAFEQLVNPENADVIRPIANELLLVTVLKVSKTEGQSCVFWVDDTLVYMTVTVEHAEPSNWVLVDQHGASARPIISTWGTKRWTVHRPRVGMWHVLHEGDTDYTVSVRGASSVDLDVSLYHTDVTTGLAEIVHDEPTAGHQIRIIIDMIGGDIIRNIYNVTLMTSDGNEVASDWLRPAGGPQDPQYETTFTWPTQPVYVRVYGLELNGNLLERQTPFMIKPVLFDLRLLGNPLTTGVVSADSPLVLDYVLTNQGPSGDFELGASLDNEVFSAVVSPAQVRLGHRGSLVGSVTISIKPGTPADTTGMLTVNAWLVTESSVIQSTTRFLASRSDVTDHDLDPPFCETTSITGNCLEEDVTSSPTCHLRHWVVRASLDDAGSGLNEVTFDDLTQKEEDVRHSVTPFTKGQANEPVQVVYNVTCCIPEVTLNASDVAMNQETCRFSRKIPVPPKPSSRRPPPHVSAKRTIPTTTTLPPPRKRPSSSSSPTATTSSTLTSTPVVITTTSRDRPSRSSSASDPTQNPGSLGQSTTTTTPPGRPPQGSMKFSSTTFSRPETNKLTSGSGVATESTVLVGVGSSEDTRGRTPTAGGSNAADGRTSQPTTLGAGFASMDTVTRHRGSKRNHSKADYSTLKTVSIILGSIGGVAGLGIGAICLVVIYRHRRLQRRQRYGSNNSSRSCDSQTSDTNSSDSGGGRYGRGGGGGRVPDLVPASSSRRHQQGEFSTPL